MPALRLQPVHQEPPEPVGNVDPHQDGLAALRLHGLPHQLVGAHEADHLIREILGGAQEGVVGLAGALRRHEGPGHRRADPSCRYPLPSQLLTMPGRG